VASIKLIKLIEKHIENSRTSFLIVGQLAVGELKSHYKLRQENFLFLEGDTIKIQEVRSLIRWINFKPLNSQYKFAFISRAEKMTIEAGNALLKTLEEPPPGSIVILSTLNEEKILPTIRSRCHRLIIEKKEEEIDIPENYKSPEDLGELSYKERFKWAGEVAEENYIKEILTLWQIYFREKLLRGEDNILVNLSAIIRSKDLLETNISVKLLLENLIVNF